MDLDVLELEQTVDVPVSAAQIILPQCVLYQVDLFRYLGGLAVGDQDRLTELAYNMSWVGVPNRGVVLHFLVQAEVLVGLADHQRPWFFHWLLLLNLRGWLLPRHLCHLMILWLRLVISQLSAVLNVLLAFG